MCKTIIRSQHIPPSANNMFVNVRGKGRVRSERYRIWAAAAGYDFNRCHAKWTEPVYLTIALGKMRKGSDVSNKIKAVEDLLVTHGIIPGDDWQWVKGVNCYLAQEPFDGFEVAITPADPALKPDTARRAA